MEFILFFCGGLQKTSSWKKPIVGKRKQISRKLLRNIFFFRNEFDLLHLLVRSLLEDLGIKRPTSIQRRTAPCILKRRKRSPNEPH